MTEKQIRRLDVYTYFFLICCLASAIFDVLIDDLSVSLSLMNLNLVSLMGAMFLYLIKLEIKYFKILKENNDE